MKRSITLTVILATCLLPCEPATGRPVSYPGGWTVMQMHNRANTSVHLHYSPTARHSIGVRALHSREEDVFALMFQSNTLLGRVNRPGSQANLYLKWAAGAGFEDDKALPAAFAGVSADWETRRLFVRYENRAKALGKAGKSFTQSARVGIAPYLAEFGSLHTWLMLEVAHYPETGDEIEVTPVARFFKNALLAEVGYSINGKLTLNFIRRF
ncbi:MAG: hypothetical protein OXF42_06455 [Candidatus Dadabacteria bacterium]|nr:hypothetical protein [Candidatus Dadabacteria bacterium]